MALTTSMTRSRRAEGAHLSNPKVANAHRLLPNAKDHYPPRPKRQLDPSERDIDNVVAKKARFTTGIAVEIPARSSLHARFVRDTADAKQAVPAPPKPAVAAPKAPTTHRAPPANGTRPAPAKTQQQHQQQPAPPKHREKVANGLKHELNKLQPSAADTKEQGRKLRSQEATRFKSELSAYFPEYDEVIGNDPKETHLLNVDTPIVIVPDPSPLHNNHNNNNNNNPLQRAQQHPPHRTAPLPPHEYPIRSYGDALYTDLFDAQRIDFSFLDKQPPPAGGGDNNYNNDGNGNAPDSDPLPDTLYSPAHRKAERLERSIRNTEKGRAQHEKDQIMRLLDGLQGHDWLRVMGVNGITESKKRAFEPARQHFIRGCENILSKFRRWAREEKRRRAEMLERKAAAHEHREGSAKDAASEGEGEEAEGHGEAEGRTGKGAARGAGGNQGEEEGNDSDDDDGGGGNIVEGEPPDDDAGSGDIDASVARQLREEALAAAAKRRRSKAAAAGTRAPAARRGAASTATAARRKTAAAAAASRSKPEPPIQEPPKPFTSFFAKRYQRDAALSKNRRKGRKVLAWGQPLPEMAEAEFQLPTGLCDEETLRAHARKKRRDKRLRK
ncbi:hypothetical protein MYCTH_2295879 [Thermothelomyces thermophilus ATCC 42464]|uniref:Something about silencing protein 4 domain-containing protein n=1 Tax=Thermothelomyces thermophilus (strain ATCC 42464 / BCRC 31852 / DSM 1799) TaxID=573729 RepID=G2Q6V6_THET4|nr:uncharacterized protein MYCTH_2295879 [Thermothelomyces thermophilus ATCC 42464]AEO53934.1 hypothetical protein MYCTH_2295879 [Thermothelomyces thermophilus ATCC 42464]